MGEGYNIGGVNCRVETRVFAGVVGGRKGQDIGALKGCFEGGQPGIVCRRERF